MGIGERLLGVLWYRAAVVSARELFCAFRFFIHISVDNTVDMPGPFCDVLTLTSRSTEKFTPSCIKGCGGVRMATGQCHIVPCDSIPSKHTYTNPYINPPTHPPHPLPRTAPGSGVDPL